MERLPMFKTREILRLRWAMGRSVRQTARSVSASVGVVSSTTHNAAAAGLTWEAVQALEDAALEARVLCWLLASSVLRSHEKLRFARTGTPVRLCSERVYRAKHVVLKSILRVASDILTLVNRKVRDLTRPLRSSPLMALADATRSRSDLIAENALLRQQLIIATRNPKARWTFTRVDRVMLVVLAAVAKHWRDALLIAKPDTLLSWHRKGFKLLWRWKTRRQRSIRPSSLSAESIALIVKMSDENRLWGAERIRGELLKLGIRVSKRTIQKYMCSTRRPRPTSGQRWTTFVRNHAHETWACDFVQTYDILFRPIFAFFVIELGTRRVAHFNVTRQPSAQWTAQQLRNATSWCNGPRFLIRDRDDKFGDSFDVVARACGTRVLKTPVRAPKANAFCERLIGSVRRECMDHVLIVSEEQMRARLDEYVRYYNSSRSHQGIEQRVPEGTTHAGPGRVTAIPVLGGLHHEYRRAA